MAQSAAELEAIAGRVAKNLRAFRKQRGVSQSKLARGAEVTEQTVRRAESGAGIPEWKTLIRFAEVLEITLWDLLGASPNERVAPGAGLEPAASRLTAERSAIELPRNDSPPDPQPSGSLLGVAKTRPNRPAVLGGMAA